MSKQTEFLKKQKILHLATVDKTGTPHIVPVWYMYSANKIYIGTNTKTEKAKNIKTSKRNKEFRIKWQKKHMSK